MHKIEFVVGAGLLGRVIDVNGAPLDGRGALSDVREADALAEGPAAAAAPAPWESGIKVIDVYAPLALGTMVALMARPGVGLFVTISELTYRLAERRGGCAVVTKLDAERNELRELTGQLRESGVEEHSVVVAGTYAASQAERRTVVRAALAAAEAFVAAGRDVLLTIDDGLLDAETAPLLRRHARVAAAGSLTILLCFWRHLDGEPATPREGRLLDEVDGTLVFSRELARQAVWPAIDALASRSRLLDERRVSAEQLALVAQARALLAQDAQSLGATERERARKLLLYQAQPFFVAEPFTARPAEYVPLDESLRSFAAIIAGAHDDTPAAAFEFIGGVRLPVLDAPPGPTDRAS